MVISPNSDRSGVSRKIEDPESRRMLKDIMEALSGGENLGIIIRTVTRQEDYRDVDGVRVAFRSVSRNEFAGETVFEMEKFETDVVIDGGLFSRPSEN